MAQFTGKRRLVHEATGKALIVFECHGQSERLATISALQEVGEKIRVTQGNYRIERMYELEGKLAWQPGRVVLELT